MKEDSPFIDLTKLEEAHLHDAVFFAKDVHMSRKELEALVTQAPARIRATAASWSWSDTCVRSELIDWLATQEGAAAFEAARAADSQR
jgi:hypothetical protein